MSDQTNFILIMIMIQIMIVSFAITSAIREKSDNNSTQTVEIKGEPTTLDILSGKAERIYVDSPDMESCKTIYPFGYQHVARDGKCSFIVWRGTE